MSDNQVFVARDSDTGVVIADRVNVAITRSERRVGLLRHSHLDPGEGQNEDRSLHRIDLKTSKPATEVA